MELDVNAAPPLDERLAQQPAVLAARAGLAEQPGVWIVGGALRDAFLAPAPVTDLDLVVSAEAAASARAIARAVQRPAFPLSEQFGAWRVVGDGWLCDVTPMQGDLIEDDLAQRDFTVNAMALPLFGGQLVDPVHGRRDLERHTLRLVAPDAYERDRLRPLRLIRFATELAFDVEPETAEATREWGPRVTEAAGERIFAELRRIVASSRAPEGLRLAAELRVLHAVLPELDDLRGIEQSQFHHLDVYDHTIEVLRSLEQIDSNLGQYFPDDAAELRQVLDEPLGDELTRAQALRFAALLHDIGKARTRSFTDTGRVTFIGHDSLGADMVRNICKRLRTSERVREFLALITRHHLVLGFLVHQRPLSRRVIYRYLKLCSPVEVEVTLLTCADRIATRGKNAEAAIEAHLGLARELMSAALRWRREGPPRAPLRGDELAAQLGIKPGPDLGRLLAELEEASYAGEVTSADQAVEYARRLRENPVER
ncbi:MAG TPA: HD domain-containing protein [Thermoleophilaceae bacterium]|nr:HD domain-containing protein [Thermoleophilaceae bacterium]